MTHGKDRRSPRVTVMVCRDCCCGTSRKHPGTDHDAQRDAIGLLASETVRVRTVDCLDECDRSNVVLVRDLTAPRRERDTWLGDLLDPADTEALVGWVASGVGELPERLRHRRFTHRP